MDMDVPLCTMETVYGSNGASDEDTGRGMSDRVQTIAANIYRELERMIPTYGEEVIKEMMPQFVNILESLDIAVKENEEKDAELELCKDDNEQLMTQYEREKQQRKSAEQKLMAMEDLMEDERRETNDKLESLQSTVRSYELKAKNTHDHLSRLEEKEIDMKKEYTKLHERYTELLKKHMDHVEKSKLMMGVEVGRGLQLPTLRHVGGFLEPGEAGFDNSGVQMGLTQGHNLQHGGVREEFTGRGFTNSRTVENFMNTDIIDVHDRATGMSNILTPESGDVPHNLPLHRPSRGPRDRYSMPNPPCILDELVDPDTLGDAEDVTGPLVNPADFSSSAGDNFFGMSKEVEHLILENSELLATKNALNVVKDDLIAQVDELMSEQEILRGEVAANKAAKEKLNARVVELEEESRKFRDVLESSKQRSPSEEDDDIPMAQRKRFTRVEMARVLMERNQYKERLMELQEAVRWTEMIRASREHPDLIHGTSAAHGGPGKKRSSIWNFFSNLFNSSNKTVKKSPTLRYNAPTSSPQRRPTAPPSPKTSPSLPAKTSEKQQRLSVNCGETESSNVDATSSKGENKKEQHSDNTDQRRQLRARIKTDDGRMQTYGWSVPVKGQSMSMAINSQLTSQRVRGQMPVPVPVYCKPVTTTDCTMKLWCAAGVCLANQDVANMNETVEATDSASSRIWICATSHADGQSSSIIYVVDAHNPSTALDMFAIPATHVLCIASVPAVEETADEYEIVNQWDNSMCESAGEDTGISLASCCSSSTSPAVAMTGECDKQQNNLLLLNQSTMWLGAQDGSVYIHSAIKTVSRPIYTVKLPDTALAIQYVANRVFIALANGTVAVFCRPPNGCWKVDTYYRLCLGKPQHSVRCIAVVSQHAIWCGYRNKVHVIDPCTLALQKSFDAHTRAESQVRQMVCLGEGVWLTMRLDSTLRLYHATTYQHLQDVDIEPYVSKMLGTGKLGFSFVRVTSLMAACSRLWIGTGNGVIICVPLSESSKPSVMPNRASSTGVYHAYSDRPHAENILTATSSSGNCDQLPYCYMAQAQLSFHGHRDAVKFFVSVPACKGQLASSDSGSGVDAQSPKPSVLVMSGGEGYVDFRVGANNTADTDDELDGGAEGGSHRGELTKTDYSQLIVWQVYNQTLGLL